MYFTQEQINNLEKSWKWVSEPGGRANSTIHPLLLKANIDRFYRAAILPQPQLKNIFLYPRRRFNRSKHSRDTNTTIRLTAKAPIYTFIHNLSVCLWADVFLKVARLSPRLWLFITEQASGSKWGRHFSEILLPDYWHGRAAAQCSDWLISDRIPSLERRAGWKNGVGGLSCCLFSLDVEKHSVPSPRLCFPGVRCLVMVAWDL